MKKKNIIAFIITSVIYAIIVNLLKFNGITLGGIPTVILFLILQGIIYFIIRKINQNDYSVTTNEQLNAPEPDIVETNNKIVSFDSNTNELVSSDLIIISSINLIKNSQLLCKNNYSICDTVLFSLYMSTSYMKTFPTFNNNIDDYFQVLKRKASKAISYYFNIPEMEVENLIYKRCGFYNELFKKYNYSNIQEAIGELIFILQYDLTYNKYVHFDFNSPIILDDFDNQFELIIETNAYINFFEQTIKKAVNNYYAKIKSQIAKKQESINNKQDVQNTKKHEKDETDIKFYLNNDNNNAVIIIAVVLFLICFSILIYTFAVVIPNADETKVTQTENYTTTSYNTEYMSETAETETETTKPKPLKAPDTGEILIQSDLPKESKLTINNSNRLCYVKMKDENKNDVFGFFVKAYDNVTMDVPAGQYYVYFATGEYWYGEEKLFGPETACTKDDDLQDFENYAMTYTLEKVSDGNFQPQSVDVEEFK